MRNAAHLIYEGKAATVLLLADGEARRLWLRIETPPDSDCDFEWEVQGEGVAWAKPITRNGEDGGLNWLLCTTDIPTTARVRCTAIDILGFALESQWIEIQTRVAVGPAANEGA